MSTGDKICAIEFALDSFIWPLFLHSLSQFALFVLDPRLPVEKGLGTTCFENGKLQVVIDRDRPPESCVF